MQRAARVIYCRAICLALLICFPAHAGDKNPHDFELKGLLQLDADWFGEFYDNAAQTSSEQEVRRARISAHYRYRKDWKAEVSVQYRDRGDDVDLNDAYIRYDGFKPFDITVGKFKQPFGMERLEGAKRRATMERSMTSELLTPDRALGVQFAKQKKDYTWAVGVFQDDDEDDRFTRSAPQSITGRATYAPQHNKEQTLHFGVAGSYRDWKSNLFDARSRAEVSTANNVVRSARFLADSQWLFGVEAAWQRGSLLLKSEYMQSEVDASGFEQQFSYSGFYLQSSFFLTGERRKYKKGEFGRVKPKKHFGAFELVARHGEIDLRDNGVGAQSSVTLLGLNYHWRKNVKIMLNVLHPEIKGDTRHSRTEGDAFTLRLEYRL
ncbi:MAG: OprO/OprP family phosphate-selective porin [Pseudomonadales bacterium]